MVSRREILVGGAGGIAVLGAGLAASRIAAGAAAVEGPGPGVSMVLVDSTLPGIAGAVEAAERAGVRAVPFAGDVGTVWLDLQQAWRSGPLPVAGVTHGGAFFCIERLARDHGLACTFRQAPPLKAPSGVHDAAIRALAHATLPLSARRRIGEKAPGEADDRALA